MTFQAAKRIRAGVAALAFFASLAPAAMAQDITDAHLAAARTAMTAIQATDPYDSILPAAAEQIKGQLIANNVDLEEQISATVDEQALALASRRADLENEAARIYAAAFTEEELKAIAAFYGTEAGKKLLQNGGIVAREVNNAAGIWRRGIERDLMENVSKKLDSAGLRPPATPATPTVPAAPAEGAAPAPTQN
ncbi:MAG: DUF2059 domain-containing protein [Oricola sp.]